MQRNTKAVSAAVTAIATQTNSVGDAPLRAWIASVISRVQLLIMELVRRRGDPLPRSAPPRRSEDEGEAGNQRQRGIGPALDRLVDGVDKIVGHVAHGMGRI